MNIKKADKIINRIAEVVSDWDKYAGQVSVERKLARAIKETLWIV